MESGEEREREDDGLVPLIVCVALLRFRFLAGLFHVAVIWRQIIPLLSGRQPNLYLSATLLNRDFWCP